ncbi:39S ribosomal protein L42, mitochondrial [Conger conger]|uniref:39S ribosomal protein L42, mitochondrial n=1 Tax=Conger conger TaxID=82655 RepID=UPI002A59AA28|nr:39S ribosomal protein L42, mitochondrial [Conger conger]
MAGGQATKLTYIFSRLSRFVAQRQLKVVTIVSTHPKSTLTGPADDLNCKVEIGLTSDGKTVVCHHPSVEVPYELTQPLPRPDPLTNPAETHDQVLRAHLCKDVLRDQQAPTIEELSKMFYTTKHRWYPVGQYHTRRKNRNPPRDR